MNTKKLFWIFPYYPNIKPDSKTSELSLQHLMPKSTKEERDETIEEYIGLDIIELCKNNEYKITPKGWDLWSN